MTSTALSREAAPTAYAPLTLGVEEEFLLIDPARADTAPTVLDVIDRLPADLRGRARLELRPSMLELITPVCDDLTKLGAQLSVARKGAATAAAGAGATLVATGISPGRDSVRDAPPDPRYRQMAERYGVIAQGPALCGCHIHVGVADRELAVQVCNHLRPWLPVIQAITANSPLHQAADTGYDSWRTLQLRHWPTVGPTPFFESAADYEHAVAQLIDTGVLLDEGMVYWYARLSAKHPTVEIRVGDVCATVEEALLVAALTRGLVATAVEDIGYGIPAPRVSGTLVTAAHWRAARDGMRSTLIDVRHGRERPAWSLLHELVGHVTPALRRHGDDELVAGLLARLRRTGTGAARQREILGVAGVDAVLASLATETAGD